MELDKILEYQKYDQELYKLENEVLRSDARQKYVHAKAQVDEATNQIKKLQKDADELLQSYGGMKTSIKKLSDELQEFDGILDDVQDVSEAEHYLKMVNAINDKLNALEKEVAQVSGRIDQVNDAFKRTWDQGVKSREIQQKAREEYNRYVGALQPKVNELKAVLAKIEKEVPEPLMKSYKALRGNKKMPAFVKYDVNDHLCARCRMEVPSSVRSKLRAPGDVAECPNCRRILYVSKDGE